MSTSPGREITVKPDDRLHHEQFRRDGGLIAFNGGFARTRPGGCFGGADGGVPAVAELMADRSSMFGSGGRTNARTILFEH